MLLNRRTATPQTGVSSVTVTGISLGTVRTGSNESAPVARVEKIETGDSLKENFRKRKDTEKTGRRENGRKMGVRAARRLFL